MKRRNYFRPISLMVIIAMVLSLACSTSVEAGGFWCADINTGFTDYELEKNEVQESEFTDSFILRSGQETFTLQVVRKFVSKSSFRCMQVNLGAQEIMPGEICSLKMDSTQFVADGLWHEAIIYFIHNKDGEKEGSSN